MDRTYPHGVTSWIDVETPDVAATTAFYGQLLGWTFEDRMPPGSPYRYVIAQLDGRDVAGVGGPHEVASWITYVAVDDADAAVHTLVAAGATLLSGPEDAGQAGRTAALRDPAGALFQVWQAGYRLGAQVVDEPGAWSSSNLHTADVEAATSFYGPAFGWTFGNAGFATSFSVPGYGDHLEAGADPDIRTRQASAPAGFADVVGSFVPLADGEEPHWEVVLTVADRDDTVARLESLGGTVVSTAEEERVRRADVRDPLGAGFVVSEFAPRDWQARP